jgi:hypothetical protein
MTTRRGFLGLLAAAAAAPAAITLSRSPMVLAVDVAGGEDFTAVALADESGIVMTKVITQSIHPDMLWPGMKKWFDAECARLEAHGDKPWEEIFNGR